MENFLSEWDQTLSNMQYGPLGIIAMQGIDELGRNINNYLLKWHELQDLQDEECYTSPGKDREDFLIDAVCPRFGTGEGKGVIGRVCVDLTSIFWLMYALTTLSSKCTILRCPCLRMTISRI